METDNSDLNATLTTNNPSPNNSSINNQKGIWLPIIGVTLVVIIVGVGAYYLGARKNNAITPQITSQTPTSQPSPTSIAQPTTSSVDKENLETYTNSKFNYSVKYPSNLELSQIDLQNAPYSAIFNIKQTEPGPVGFPSLYISVIPDGFTNTGSVVYNFMPADVINSFYTMSVGDVKQTQTGTYSEFWTYKKLQNTTVAGQKGIVIENSKVWEGGNGLVDRRVYIKKNGYTYMIGTYYQTPQELNTFQNFLSNFTFTK